MLKSLIEENNMHIGDLVKIKIKNVWKTGIFMGEARNVSFSNGVRIYLHETGSEELHNMYEIHPLEESGPCAYKIIIDCKNPFHVRRVSAQALCDSCVMEQIA